MAEQAARVGDLTGEPFALWISGVGSEVYALSTVTEPPIRATDPDPFRVDPDQGDKADWRIGIRINRKLETPIARSDLQADPLPEH